MLYTGVFFFYFSFNQSCPVIFLLSISNIVEYKSLASKDMSYFAQTPHMALDIIKGNIRGTNSAIEEGCSDFFI